VGVTGWLRIFGLGDMSVGHLFLALALTLNATANVLLKVGAARLGGLEEPSLIGRLITNYHLLAGLSLFALNVVFYVLALTRLNLSVAYPIMMAGGVIIVVSVSILFLQEAVTARQMFGLVLLILGIVLVAERSTT
jgi:multidrug transporter EmrE-like cation transporter